MKVNKWVLLSAALCSMMAHYANAALALDATRYVYDEERAAISVVVNNASGQEYGGQVWVDNIQEQDTRPVFIAAPSFFKIKRNGRQVFRLMKVSDHMPKDKESIYWLNLQEIPPKIDGSGISLAIRTKVKVIYRPAILAKGRANAEELMSIQRLPGKQYLVNSTPYIFAIGAIYDSKGKVIDFMPADQDKLTMFMPGDKVDVTGAEVKSVMALNDFGNVESYKLKKDDQKSLRS